MIQLLCKKISGNEISEFCIMQFSQTSFNIQGQTKPLKSLEKQKRNMF